MKKFIVLTSLVFTLHTAGAETRTEITCELLQGYRFTILENHPAPGDTDLGDVTFARKHANGTVKDLFKVSSKPVEITGKKRPLALLSGTMSHFHIDVDDLISAKSVDQILNGAKPKDIALEGTELSELQSISFALNEKKDGGYLTLTSFRNTGTGHYLSSTGPVDCVAKDHQE